MVDVNTLRPGMKVKIVDYWVPGCLQNNQGKMDKYLGAVVTILRVKNGFAFIEEDEGERLYGTNSHWYWNSNCFDYIVDDTQDDFEPSSENEIFSFIFRD